MTQTTDNTTDLDPEKMAQAAKDFGVPYVDPKEMEQAQQHFDHPEINDPGFVTAIKAGVGQQASALARTATTRIRRGGAWPIPPVLMRSLRESGSSRKPSPRIASIARTQGCKLARLN